MRKAIWTLSLVCAAIFAPPDMRANVYFVDLTIGAGSLAGSITTDGTIGALDTSNIVAWDLALNDGTSVISLTNSNSVAQVIGADLTASPSALFFNFSGIDYGQFDFYNQTSEPNFGTVCIEDLNNNCGGDSSSIVLYDLDQDGLYASSDLSGNQQISGPEPVSAALWLTGIGAMILVRRRRHGGKDSPAAAGRKLRMRVRPA